ncbi:MAG: prepilin-type N-terminal cleavage/methylation domain-containing protein, partial [Oscillospiraceae bacterium]|nr:prepilin-type N-terminal cleavage/methylation domain-containing protein [Oscillospiraceae bacterium]
MKHNNDGFSLVEIVAAIAILGIFFGTACSGLVLGLRMNEKTDAMLQAQLAVSSAVETLMAEGIDPAKIIEDDGRYDDYPERDDTGSIVKDNEGNDKTIDRFSNVTVITNRVTKGEGDDTVSLPYFKVTVTSTVENVTVTT